MERKFLTSPFTLKSVNDIGQFKGRASVYGNVDAYGDVVMPGAFDRSLEELSGRIVVLNQHNPSDPIGTADLSDSEMSLNAAGQLILELPSAKDAHTRLKHGLIDGISIGYEVVKEAYVGNVRQLQEIKLWEISLVTFPANQFARVTDVKHGRDPFHQLVHTIRRHTAEMKKTLQHNIDPDPVERFIDNLRNTDWSKQ